MRSLDSFDSESVWCDRCGAEITWAPVAATDGTYCCGDCAAGERCGCWERTRLDVDQDGVRRARAALPEAHY